MPSKKKVNLNLLNFSPNKNSYPIYKIERDSNANFILKTIRRVRSVKLIGLNNVRIVKQALLLPKISNSISRKTVVKNINVTLVDLLSLPLRTMTRILQIFTNFCKM